MSSDTLTPRAVDLLDAAFGQIFLSSLAQISPTLVAMLNTFAEWLSDREAVRFGHLESLLISISEGQARRPASLRKEHFVKSTVVWTPE